MDFEINVDVKESILERADDFNRVYGEIERIEQAAKLELEALVANLSALGGTGAELKEKYRAEAGIIVKKAHEEMHILMSQTELSN